MNIYISTLSNTGSASSNTLQLILIEKRTLFVFFSARKKKSNFFYRLKNDFLNRLLCTDFSGDEKILWISLSVNIVFLSNNFIIQGK